MAAQLPANLDLVFSKKMIDRPNQMSRFAGELQNGIGLCADAAIKSIATVRAEQPNGGRSQEARRIDVRGHPEDFHWIIAAKGRGHAFGGIPVVRVSEGNAR